MNDWAINVTAINIVCDICPKMRCKMYTLLYFTLFYFTIFYR